MGHVMIVGLCFYVMRSNNTTLLRLPDEFDALFFLCFRFAATAEKFTLALLSAHSKL